MESDQEGLHKGKKFVKGVFQDRSDMIAKFANVSIEPHFPAGQTTTRSSAPKLDRS